MQEVSCTIKTPRGKILTSPDHVWRKGRIAASCYRNLSRSLTIFLERGVRLRDGALNIILVVFLGPVSCHDGGYTRNRLEMIYSQKKEGKEAYP